MDVLLITLLMAALSQCQSLCSTETTSLLSSDAIRPRAAVDAASPNILDIWIDVRAAGVYSPALTGGPLALDWLKAGDAVKPLPSYLDELAQKGYLAIRVPHAPPAYTSSSLIPGIPSSGSPHAVEFNYYSPPDVITRTTAPVTVTRVLTYEDIVNAKYPINDGKSHWEVWWVQGNQFPIPADTFRLKDEWPPPIAVKFRVDVGSGGNASSLAGQMVEVLLYNGYTFIGPFRAPLVIEFSLSKPNNPPVVFDQACGYFATYLQYITPTAPFTHTHFLGNYETKARTYTITASSSQGWAYTYYYGSPSQRAPGLPFTVTVGAGTGDFPECIQISAICTPTIPVTSTVRETFTITATSTVSPTTVWASATSVALAPGYQLNEEGGFKLYLPLVLRN